MIFRCKRCQSTVWYGTNRPGGGTVIVRCRGCGQPYDLGRPREIVATSRRLAGRARSFAAEAAIDLPGAYSVLLGLMTEKQARAPVPVRELSAAPVSLGRTNPTSRPAWHDARSTREGEGAAPLRIRCQASPSHRPLLLAAVLAVILLVALAMRPGGPDTSTPAAARGDASSAETSRDQDGRVLRIVGPDPSSVLRSYCISGSERGRFQPLAVVPSSTGGGRTRLGLLRDPAAPEVILAITILEDREGARWVVGDGVEPVTARPAPPGAEEALLRTSEKG